MNRVNILVVTVTVLTDVGGERKKGVEDNCQICNPNNWMNRDPLRMERLGEDQVCCCRKQDSSFGCVQFELWSRYPCDDAKYEPGAQ